jgi:hypothetical protein
MRRGSSGSLRSQLHLEIQEGDMASLQYYRMIFKVTDETEKARLRRALLEYYERDGLAMGELRNALMAKVTSAAP